MRSLEITGLAPEHEHHLRLFFDRIDHPGYREYFAPHPFNGAQAKIICSYQGRDRYYAVIINKEEMIGYCMLRGWDEGFRIPSIGLCILEEYQGLGLGTLLMDFLETVCRLNNSGKVMLKVRKSNNAGISMYVNRGYELKEHDGEFLIGYKNLDMADNYDSRF